MSGLFAPPDRAESIFVLKWLFAFAAGLVFYVANAEGFAWLHAEVQAMPSRSLTPDSDAMFGGMSTHDIAAMSEGLAGFAVALLAMMLPWFALRPLYARPTLAGWLGWMMLAVLIFIGISTVAVLAATWVDDPTFLSLPASVGPVVYTLIVVADYTSKIGIALAFLVIGWRIGLSVALATGVATAILLLIGFSSVTNDFLVALRTLDQPSVWGKGASVPHVVELGVEVLLVGLLSAIAVVIGNRWQAVTLEEPVFD